ncbi:MAG: HIRAN domain-containing protein [Ilumatobacteraceae bacterium]
MPLRRPRPPRLLPDQLVVTGERHHSSSIQEILIHLAEGRLQYRCTASLIREFDNIHDPHAVAVIVDDRRVGHIARAHSEAVAEALGKKTVELKCIINWNGEIVNGVYRVKLFPAL